MKLDEAVNRLKSGDYVPVIEEGVSPDGHTLRASLAKLARKLCEGVYGQKVFIRGLIEVSSYCKNNCLYCGLRASNLELPRYRLKKEEILNAATNGYKLGFRTVVLQGGEDAYFSDAIVCEIIESIKSSHPDMAITLSLGERSRESYFNLRKAGADRYLLRHETADKQHYEKLHPKEMSFEHRIKCLHDLRELGYQVGCGFMVGSPGQTFETIAKDLEFISSFKPEMCGIGPFIPHHATPFANYPAGSAEVTYFLLSIIRIIHPNVLLPATTALSSLDQNAREKAFLAGANVIMPNLSPLCVRSKYAIYDNKAHTGGESAEGLLELNRQIDSLGLKIVVDRGDYCP